MDNHWKKSVIRISMWLVAEILLNLLGIDDLADYSEFVFESSPSANHLAVSMYVIRHS
ncbi:MAG: hypothetical protein AB4041_10845 [Microcystaceae cyanobacterium]